jgi:hypothetical protein
VQQRTIVKKCVSLFVPPSPVLLSQQQSAVKRSAHRSASSSAGAESGSSSPPPDDSDWVSLGSSIDSWQQYSAASYKFLVSDELAVVSSDIAEPKRLHEEAFQAVHKTADSWRCRCPKFLDDNSCFHADLAASLERTEHPILDSDSVEAKREDVVELIPYRAWMVAGNGFAHHFVVVNERAHVSSFCSFQIFTCCYVLLFSSAVRRVAARAHAVTFQLSNLLILKRMRSTNNS